MHCNDPVNTSKITSKCCLREALSRPWSAFGETFLSNASVPCPRPIMSDVESVPIWVSHKTEENFRLNV